MERKEGGNKKRKEKQQQTMNACRKRQMGLDYNAEEE